VRILITGASGALGQALIRRLKNDPLIERLCLMSRDEHKLYKLASEYDGSASIRTFIADVRDRERMRTACQNVDAVIHAAALKRIDAIVNESIELDKTNVSGTVNVLHAAMEAGVRKVLFISSDKAVHPANAYGTTKMMAECHAVGFNTYSYPRGLSVSVVRYGNVAKSTGSIYHIWKRCIAEGKKLPLTSFNMTRFHISMEQAVEFCISSLQRMQGGEIFVPDLPAYRLKEVGIAMLMNAGQIIDSKNFGDIFDLVGLRPGGEKLAERMLSDEEPSRTIWQEDRYVVMPSHRTWSDAPYRGKVLACDPHLSSDWESRWMTIDQLRKEFA
jgi:UDP-N-acetylglucosamine 4,6-dehydratase